MKRSAKDRRGVLNLFSSHFEGTFFLNEALKEMQAVERRHAAEIVREWTANHEVFGETIVDVYLDDLARLTDRIESGE